MRIIEDYIDNINITENLSVALGTFDGIHRGHRQLIQRSVQLAKELCLKSAVITFDTHPLKILKPESHVHIITDNQMKAEIINGLGVDYLIFIKFTKELAGIDEKRFIELLTKKLRAKAITCGFNYTYGRLGHGNVSTLKSHQKELDFKLSIINKVTYKGNDISSSLIRHRIEQGDISSASDLLGYTYYIKGTVIQGKQLGRKLGFPTANIRMDDSLCVKNGVYITLSRINGRLVPGVSSIGKNPTVEDKHRVFETHLFEFNEDLYGSEISVKLLHFIRGECKFHSVEELKDRVFMDMTIARQFFSDHDVYKLDELCYNDL